VAAATHLVRAHQGPSYQPKIHRSVPTVLSGGGIL
jgi:hypothetical protein